MRNRRVSRRLWVGGLLGMLMVGLGLAVWPVGPRPAQAQAAEPSLHDTMHALEENLAQVKKQLSDPAANPQTLTLIVEMQGYALTAKAKKPPKPKDLPADKVAEHNTAYRKQVIALLTELLKLEGAVLEGRNKDALETVKVIEAVRDQGHKRFMPE